jgi:hypothetical protein
LFYTYVLNRQGIYRSSSGRAVAIRENGRGPINSSQPQQA